MIISALTPLVSAALPFVSLLMASSSSCIGTGVITVVVGCHCSRGFDGGGFFLSPRTFPKISAVCVLLSLFLIARIIFLIVLLVSFVFYLSSFGVVLRFCLSRRWDSACSLIVIALSWVSSFCVVDALMVMAVSSLLSSSSRVARSVVVLRACSC